jgi:DNA-binding NarL/FixJ family response regulator
MRKIRVLIVDDNAAVRNGLSSILSAHTDIEVVGKAVDGPDALAKAEELHPEVVLMDAQMPEMGGAEVTQRIKEQHPELKVLFLTVHASHIEGALAAGADGYLMKDCRRGELLEVIRGLVAS